MEAASEALKKNAEKSRAKSIYEPNSSVDRDH